MKWIKIEEQPPLNIDSVIVYQETFGVFVGEYEGNYTFYVEMTDSDPTWIRNCTHWMPLPDPPQPTTRSK